MIDRKAWDIRLKMIVKVNMQLDSSERKENLALPISVKCVAPSLKKIRRDKTRSAIVIVYPLGATLDPMEFLLLSCLGVVFATKVVLFQFLGAIFYLLGGSLRHDRCILSGLVVVEVICLSKYFLLARVSGGYIDKTRISGGLSSLKG
jgi:hypothetical protein